MPSLPHVTRWCGPHPTAAQGRVRRAIATALGPLIASGVAVLAPVAPAHAATPTCHGAEATIVVTSTARVVHGTPGRDVIVGSPGNDTILAGGGNDLVCGGDGADHLYGGPGNDRLYGQRDLFEPPTDEDGSTRAGDTLDGGPGNDRLSGGIDDRPATEGFAPDTFTWDRSAHGVRIDLRTGTARGDGRDTFTGGTIAVIATSHGDVIEGSGRADRIEAGAGPDVVRARGGNDIVRADGTTRGRAGDADHVWGGDGDDDLAGWHGKDHIYAGAGDDEVSGGGFTNDVLFGGDGNDFFLVEIGGTGGPQSFDGGLGTDTVTVTVSEMLNPNHAATTGVWDMATGATEVTTDRRTISLTMPDFERGTFSAASSRTPDTSWTVTGTAGDDVVAGEANQSVPLHFDGLGGNDVFRGTNGDDVFNGGPGNDHADGMFDGDDTCTSVETLRLPDCEHVS